MKTFTGNARQAGKWVYHAVMMDGVEIGKRRSARRYGYVFLRANRSRRELTYDMRWSRTGLVLHKGEIMVRIEDEP